MVDWINYVSKAKFGFMEPDDHRQTNSTEKYGYEILSGDDPELLQELVDAGVGHWAESRTQHKMIWRVNQKVEGIQSVYDVSLQIVAAMRHLGKWGTFNSATAGERFWKGFLKRVEWEVQHGSNR